MSTQTFTKPKSEPERDRWGRPLILQPDGKKTAYRRMTSFIDVLDDRFQLEQWKTRQVATGLALRTDLVLKAQAAQGMDDQERKRELNAVSKQAMDAAASSAAATTGSALHSFTEQVDLGYVVKVPDTMRPDVDAYRRVLDEWRMNVRHVEVFTVYDPFKVGGTFDRVVEIDGVLYVLDIKTGRVDYGASKIEMQLAGYSRSDVYDIATGERSTLDVDQDRGIVVHLPAGEGRAEVKWADLNKGWEGVQLAHEVWQWRGYKTGLKADPPAGVRPGGAPDLLALIDIAADPEGLRELWRAYEDAWTEEHTRAAKNKILDLQRAAALAAAAN